MKYLVLQTMNFLQRLLLLMRVIFFQLPTVGGKPLYATYKNTWKSYESLWKRFKTFELIEVMRQRGDSQLIDLSNHVRVADIKPTDIELLESRVIQPSNDQYPHDALHIFAENENANQHNLENPTVD